MLSQEVPDGPSELRAALLERRELDQQARGRFLREGSREAGEAFSAVDAMNAPWFKGVLAKFGWPGFALVGADGEDAAYLLAQHLDKDLELQEQCLELLRDAVARGDALRLHLSFLEDRVRYNKGQEQLFGTQFDVVDERLIPRPIEDVANVHRRRREWGLPPLHEHYKARHCALGLSGSDDYSNLAK